MKDNALWPVDFGMTCDVHLVTVDESIFQQLENGKDKKEPINS